MKEEDIILELKKDIFYRAKLFIDDMGEFAPFGSVFTEGEVKQVVIYDDINEENNGIYLIDVLKNQLSNRFKTENTKACAIAYDVILKNQDSKGEVEKNNALCLLISTDGITWEDNYYIYKVINNKCFWD